MKTFYVSQYQPIEKYDSIEEAGINSQINHKTLVENLSFDIEQFKGKQFTRFYSGDRFLSLGFSDDSYLNVFIKQLDLLELSKTFTPVQKEITVECVEFEYQDKSADIWDPYNCLIFFLNKFIDGFYLSNNWCYVYFKDIDYLLSVTLINVLESPHQIVYWEKSL